MPNEELCDRQPTFLEGSESNSVMTSHGEPGNSADLTDSAASQTTAGAGKNGPGARTVRYVVAALILRGSTVLICQRRGDQPMAHKWEFPGGKIEAGETPEEALVRELTEELNIQAEIGPPLTRLRHTYRSGGAVDLQFFVVHRFGGELRNNIFQKMVWCDLHDLPNYDFLAADTPLVRDLAAGKLL
jgi:8-oxo-dGTP diphosphatase